MCGLAGPLAGFQLDKTPGQQEKNEHADRIKVRLPGARHRGIAAGHKRDHQRDAHRHIHVQAARFQGTPRRPVKRLPGIQKHRQAHHQPDPVKKIPRLLVHAGVIAEVHRHRIHHGLHRPQTGHTQLHQHLPRLPRQQRPVGVLPEGPGAVTQPLHLLDQLTDRLQRILPAHMQALTAQVHGGLRHTGQLQQFFFNQPATGGTAHPADAQLGAGQALFLKHKGLLQRRLVKRPQERQPLGQWCGAAQLGAVQIVAVQTGFDDALCGQLAAQTAHGPVLAQNPGLERRLRQGIATVKARPGGGRDQGLRQQGRGGRNGIDGHGA